MKEKPTFYMNVNEAVLLFPHMEEDLRRPNGDKLAVRIRNRGKNKGKPIRPWYCKPHPPYLSQTPIIRG